MVSIPPFVSPPSAHHPTLPTHTLNLSNLTLNPKAKPFEPSSTPTLSDWRNLFGSIGCSNPNVLQYVEPIVVGGTQTASCKRSKIEKIAKRWEDTLFGVLLGKKPHLPSLRNYLISKWKLTCSLELTFQAEGAFILRFGSAEERLRVLESGPWFVGGRLLILKIWRKGLKRGDLNIATIPVWVRLPNLPLEFWSTYSLSRIGSVLGNPLLVDDATIKQARTSFARICVEVDSSTTFPKEVRVDIDGSEDFSQEVIFEWKPTACSCCANFLHRPSSCGKAKVRQAPVKVAIDNTPKNGLTVVHNKQWRKKTRLEAIQEEASIFGKGVVDAGKFALLDVSEEPGEVSGESRQFPGVPILGSKIVIVMDDGREDSPSFRPPGNTMEDLQTITPVDLVIGNPDSPVVAGNKNSLNEQIEEPATTENSYEQYTDATVILDLAEKPDFLGCVETILDKSCNEITMGTLLPDPIFAGSGTPDMATYCPDLVEKPVSLNPLGIGNMFEVGDGTGLARGVTIPENLIEEHRVVAGPFLETCVDAVSPVQEHFEPGASLDFEPIILQLTNYPPLPVPNQPLAKPPLLLTNHKSSIDPNQPKTAIDPYPTGVQTLSNSPPNPTIQNSPIITQTLAQTYLHPNQNLNPGSPNPNPSPTPNQDCSSDESGFDSDSSFPPGFMPTPDDVADLRELMKEGVSLVPIEHQKDFIRSVDLAGDGDILDFFQEKFRGAMPLDEPNFTMHQGLRRSPRLKKKPAKMIDQPCISGLKKGFIK